jgi:hypothetical protein
MKKVAAGLLLLGVTTAARLHKRGATGQTQEELKIDELLS